MKNPLRSLLKRAYRRHPRPAVVARRRGHNLLLSPHNWIDNRLLAGAGYEDKQIAFAKQLIHDRQINTVIDIGANFGLYTMLLGHEATVPVKRNFAQLLGNAFVNELAGRLTAHNMALGAKPGTAEIHINPRSTGVSRLSLAHTKKPTDFTTTESVTIDTLDAICPLSGRRVFMKIDVEGHAADVISGARNFLARNDVVIQMEVSPTETAAVRALEEAGLTPLHRIDDDIYFSQNAGLPHKSA